MTSSWFNAAFHCFIVILIIHIKHLFTLFLNFYMQSTLNCMTSCHGATPTVNSRCTYPTRVHRSWLRVHDVNGTLFHRSWTRDHEITTSMERSNSISTHQTQDLNTPASTWLNAQYLNIPDTGTQHTSQYLKHTGHSISTHQPQDLNTPAIRVRLWLTY